MRAARARPTRKAAEALCAGSFAGMVRPYSGLIPANLITSANFSVLSAIRLPNATGEPARTTPPSPRSAP
jgi:hypothetical protein